MKIKLKAGETDYEATLDVGVMGVELEGVYNGVGIQCDDGYFGIAQRDGGIEVMIDGKGVFPPSFSQKRKALGDAILDDPDAEVGYRSNVAILLYDRFNKADFSDPGVRNEAASMILNLIFRSGAEETTDTATEGESASEPENDGG